MLIRMAEIHSLKVDRKSKYRITNLGALLPNRDLQLDTYVYQNIIGSKLKFGRNSYRPL